MEAQGSGKGTQCRRMAAKSGMIHLSTGDLCREEVSGNTELGKRVQDYVTRRDLVPDLLIVEIVLHKLKQLSSGKGILLDGFPRTVDQARALLTSGHTVERVVLLQASDETCVERILKRKRDSADCDEAAIRARLRVFHQNNKKVIELFPGKVQTLDSQKPETDVFTELEKILSQACSPSDVVMEDEDGGWGEAFANANQVSEVKIDISPVEYVPLKGGETKLAVTIRPPDLLERVPVDICCVIDISGSMGSEAKFQDPDDDQKQIGSGFSQLDLVKHAVKTVIHTLTDNDRLSIVAFDSRAEVSFPLTEMTADGIAKATQAVERLDDRGTTNIWEGLRVGLETIRTVSHNDSHGHVRPCSVFLLTDGVPDASDVSEQQHFERYRKQFPHFTCQVNTFGFGYSLQSDMLLALAELGNGTFSFIPDAKILGTCFVNTTANACSCMAQDCTVVLKAKNGAKLGSDGSLSQTINLGYLQYGQPRDIVGSIFLPGNLDEKEYLEVTVTFTDLAGKQVVITAHGSSHFPTPDSRMAFLRTHMIDEVSKSIAGSGTSLDRLTSLAENFVVGSDDARFNALKEDILGRVSKAVTTSERYKRWGSHYLRAINRAHQLQVRTNFMDPGLQVYGGSLFEQLQHRGGEIFVSLPMNSTRSSYSYSTTTTTAASASNAVYYAGGGGGCFDADCTVVVRKSGEEKAVTLQNVRKGDHVRVIRKDGALDWAKVQRVVRIEREGSSDLVHFQASALKITEKHPINFDGSWEYPKNFVVQGSDSVVYCKQTTPFVFNFVLEGSRILLVNGIQCLTFGHGVCDDPVAWHPFYATDRVLDVISALDEDSEGFVNVKGSLRQFEKQM